MTLKLYINNNNYTFYVYITVVHFSTINFVLFVCVCLVLEIK